MSLIRNVIKAALLVGCIVQPVTSKFRILQPISDAKEIPNTEAQFGLPNYGGKLTGKLFYGTEGDLDGCSPLFEPGVKTPWADTLAEGQSVIIMVDRGNNCTFVQKVRNGQNAAATAVVVVDNVDEAFLPIMGNDGSGNSINIPSIMISKKSGDELKKLITDKKSVMVNMSWNVPTTDTTVEYEYWMTANDDSRQFKHDWASVATNLGDRAHVNAHWAFIPGNKFGCTLGSAGNRPCGKQCTNKGMYCAQDPDGDITKGEDGEDVVAENVRQLCIFKNMDEAKTVEKWWTYIDLVYQNCVPNDSTFNKDCSNKQQIAASIDTTKTDSCVTECGGTEAEDGVNKCIESELEAAKKINVRVLPSVYVNARIYNGRLDCETPVSVNTCGVLDELCQGYTRGFAPAACSRTYCWETVDECGVCGGNGVTDDCGTCLTAADKNTPKWNAACMGCDNIPNSGKVVDPCGQCGGAGSFDICGSCFPAADSRRVTDPAKCNEKSGGSWTGTIIGLILLCAGGATGFVYMNKRETRMKAEMESVLARYMPLDTANDFAHTNEGEGSNLLSSI